MKVLFFSVVLLLFVSPTDEVTFRNIGGGGGDQHERATLTCVSTTHKCRDATRASTLYSPLGHSEPFELSALSELTLKLDY